MVLWELVLAALPALVLFLYGIEHFSAEVQRAAGQRFRRLLSSVTDRPVNGTLLGAGVTAVVQSSTATTVIVVGLVNAGVLSFSQSLGVIFGANIGTTVTSQLVALELTAIAPVFIVLGFLLGMFGGRYQFLGKPVFYFGLVFFSLNMLSGALEPLKTQAEAVDALAFIAHPLAALVVSAVFTVLVQSSSVTTGIIVLLAGSGLLPLMPAIAAVLGANLGTTSTSLFASAKMDLYARRAAMAHVLFNVGGVLLFLPLLGVLESFVVSLGGSPAQHVANAHLVFNVATAAVFLAVLHPFSQLVERFTPGTEKEILLRTKYLYHGVPKETDAALALVEKELAHAMHVTLQLFDEAAKVAKNDAEGRMQRVEKLETLNDLLDERVSAAILDLSRRKLSASQAQKTVLLVRMSNAVEQLGDLGAEFAHRSEEMHASGTLARQAIAKEILDIYHQFKKGLVLLSNAAPFVSASQRNALRGNDDVIRSLITKHYAESLPRLQGELDSAFVELLAILESATSKAREIRKLCEQYSSAATPSAREKA